MTTFIREFESILVLIATLAKLSDCVIVNTTNGQVRGVVKQYYGEDVLQFKKIPFAKPPVGDLRFRKPQSVEPWDNVLDATKFGPSCMQYLLGNDEWLLDNKETSEDCLHLNIYVPYRIDRTHPKAVMIWIHGGGFTAGQATLIDGSYLALQGDVIIVMVNYRLGLFGFLSTEDDTARGNYGLWDQKLAIQWVHDNIEYFGGDNKQVCIFGESAGGYSVGLQSIIPSNKGLFQRVISESGAVKSPRALAVGSKQVAIEAGRRLNCTIDNITVLVECLRNATAEEILQVQGNAKRAVDKKDTFISRLGPVLDNDLLTIDPNDLLTNLDSESYRFFKSLDVMAGTNNAEGGLMYWRMMQYQASKNFNISQGISKQALCEVVAPLVADNYFSSNTNVSQAICDQYSVLSDNIAEQGRNTVNIYADMQFIIPTVETLLAHSYQKGQTGTYHYIFAHQPSSPWIQDRPPWLIGANHAGELPFVFGLESMYKNSSAKPPDEMALSKQMKIYWTNFAKTGDPNKGTNNYDGLVEWPSFDSTTRQFLNLSIPISSGKHLFADRVKFWTVTLPTIADPVIKTTNGGVQGLMKTYHGNRVLQFKGIPYAKSPVGELRFSKPVKHPLWKNVLKAFNFGPSCLQISSTGLVQGSEDCLYLNIYIPYGIDRYKPRAVMIWIHGGAFRSGSGSRYDSSYLSLIGDVIIVTINYRLGLLGFLSTEDNHAVGNYGLWDQKMAIQWVHDNAHTFGGDRNRICLFGESAGGYSVGLQTISPSNDGLFQRVITESGTVLSPRAISHDSLDVANQAGKLVQCATNETRILVSCLRNKSARSLIMKQNQAIRALDKTETLHMRLGPVIDKELVIATPEEVFTDKTSNAYKMFTKLDILAGTNSAEGSLWNLNKYEQQYNFHTTNGIPKRVLCDVIAPSAARSYYHNNADIRDAICDFYSTVNNFIVNQSMAALGVYSDLFFNVPTTRTLLAHAEAQRNVDNKRSTYQYLFSHRPFTQSGPSWITGAKHGAEVKFVFGFDGTNSINTTWPQSELELSNKMMLYWTNFAKTGNPNTGSTEILESWPGFTNNETWFMNFSLSPQSQTALYDKRVKFWMNTVPGLVKQHKGTENSADRTNHSVTVLLLHAVVLIGTIMY